MLRVVRVSHDERAQYEHELGAVEHELQLGQSEPSEQPSEQPSARQQLDDQTLARSSGRGQARVRRSTTRGQAGLHDIGGHFAQHVAEHERRTDGRDASISAHNHTTPDRFA